MSYTIVSGDTFSSIAIAHGTSIAALEAANPGVNPSSLQVGQIINLSSAGGSSGGNSGSSSGSSVGGGYVAYSGPASGFPDPSTWADYGTLWSQNSPLMALNDSASEVGFIKAAIEKVGPESGIDVRAILCIIMQESGGNVRVGTTNNGVGNPGIMQSHAGVAFNPSDPQGSILQMVRDGTEGTSSGDGLKQLYAQYNNYYEAFRAYNSGSVDQNNLNDPVGATATYVQSVANRLMGHKWAGIIQVDRVESAIERVNARQDETARLLTALVSALGPQLPLTPPAFDFKADSIGCTFSVPVKDFQEKISVHPPTEKAPIMTRHQQSIGTTGLGPSKSVQVYARKSTAHCKIWCSCTCHKKHVLRLKQHFTNAIGSFSFAYSGLPRVTASCDEKSCASKSLPSIAMTIQFPAWFLKRCLSTSLTYAPAAGPNINIKLPRTVDWTWKLWRYAPEGNMRAIKDLFATGAASPWDVSPLGGSALHYAVDHGQFEICRFLIDEGALKNQEDGFNKSPTELAWEKIFSGDLTEDEASTVANMFDDDEFLQNRQFTVLHKVVLGLIPKQLQDELEYSTKDIDVVDSSGRTCVSWAAARGDEKSLGTLLQYGADPNLPDTQGSVSRSLIV